MSQFVLRGKAVPGKAHAPVAQAMTIIRNLIDDQEIIHDLDVALTEACANVAKHAYPKGEPGDVEVTIAAEPGRRITLTVADWGRGAGSTDEHDLPDDPSSVSGRGLFMIRKLTDKLNIINDDGKHLVVMEKYVPYGAWRTNPETPTMDQKQPTIPVWPKFQNEKPTILLLTSQYFLMGEITAALDRAGVNHQLLDIGANELGLQDFVKTVLGALTILKPDFVLTVNHLGVDREGVLAQILDAMQLPLASWFVDNPHLILPLYPRLYQDRTALFTWDADNLESLGQFGFTNLFHLPLGTDPNRFNPDAPAGPDEWRADVSFVGNSMLGKVAKRFEVADPSPVLAKRYQEVADGFGASDETSAARFMLTNFPELAGEFQALESPLRMLAFETLVTWQSTMDYRLACLDEVMAFGPLIVGDPGWNTLLENKTGWRYHPELSYYDELPRFYPLSKINFNCTSLQMKGAVNQRVFDVPAAGAFLLTDHRRQLEELFEPGKEIVIYKDLDEIAGLAERYLADDAARAKVAEAARKRVLAEHTYDHRIASLIRTMRETFV